MNHRPSPHTVPEMLARAEDELENRMGPPDPVVPDPCMQEWLHRTSREFRERIIRLEQQCDLPGLAENKHRERGWWFIAAGVVSWLVAAAVPLLQAWVWIQVGPLFDGRDGKWTLHSATIVTTAVLMLLFAWLGVIAFTFGGSLIKREVPRGID